MDAFMAAVCFVTKGDQLLVIDHTRGRMKGQRSIIGGHLEDGETPDEAVRREVEEETGLHLTEYRQAGQVLVYFEAGSLVHLSLFTATGFTGTLQSSDEGVVSWQPLGRDLGLLEHVQVLLPLVLEPDTYVTGPVRVAADGRCQGFTLQHLRVAGTEHHQR